jgi:hypothetical protein
MAGRSTRRDERAVSESAGIAILVGFTVLVTASVGVSVLFVDGEESAGTSANFTFDYRSGGLSLIVRHEQGDAIPAGQLVIAGEAGSVTWAEVADRPANESVGPGSLIQLSEGSAWGAAVRRGQTIQLYYDPGDGNRTLLDTWQGTSP